MHKKPNGLYENNPNIKHTNVKDVILTTSKLI